MNGWMTWPLRVAAPVLMGLAISTTTAAEDAPSTGSASTAPASAGTRRLRAHQVFRYDKAVIFQDDFRSGLLDRWRVSEDDRYGLSAATPERLRIVQAPELAEGCHAVRFEVARAPNSFRAEISLPHEKGFQERWYAARVLIPRDWVLDSTPGEDIVMQWHAIPGDWRPTFPNLAISVSNDRWRVRQSFGDPKTKATRPATKLEEVVRPGTWVSWVIHAKWSPGPAGSLRVWKDGKLVVDRPGANVYGTIGVEYTPYLKMGIYHPEWHLDQDAKRQAFDKEKPAATKKVLYVTDVKVGNKSARLEDMLPPAALNERPR